MAVENGKVLLLGKVWCWRSLYLKPLSDREADPLPLGYTAVS